MLTNYGFWGFMKELEGKTIKWVEANDEGGLDITCTDGYSIAIRAVGNGGVNGDEMVYTAVLA